MAEREIVNSQYSLCYTVCAIVNGHIPVVYVFVVYIYLCVLPRLVNKAVLQLWSCFINYM